MIAEQMARAKQILKEHEAGHHAMADLLIEKEVITHEDVEAILGPRQWKSRGDELIADNQAKAAAEETLPEGAEDKTDEQILAEAQALYDAEQKEAEAAEQEDDTNDKKA